MARKKLVVLSGAGISAESGLKTFRDSDGLWEGYNIEDVATPGAWRKNPALVLEFYNYRREQVLLAEPNLAHKGLVELEEYFDVSIITQNIDDLHERAGSSNVLHLHGEILKMRSEYDPGLIYPIRANISLGDLAEDGRQLRPAIVWFEEPVPMIEPAIYITEQADIFLVIGTSLVVYPAAGLLDYVPIHVPAFIIDKKIPASNRRITRIEKPATEGIAEFIEMVKPLA
jgi:NAD-dependent deacetylase